jgi:hypothetical protein
MKRLVGILAVLALVTGCVSTTYHEHRAERDGGYDERRIDDTTFAVKFLANHSTDANTQRMLLQRCAVIASANGYAYFNVLTIEGSDNEMRAVIRLTNVKGGSYPSARIDPVTGNPPVNVAKLVCASVVFASDGKPYKHY